MRPESGEFLRFGLRATAVIACAASGLAIPFGGLTTALGILFGAMVGWLNVWWLTRSLARVFDQAAQHRGRSWIIGGGLWIKWPVVLALLAVVLVYRPDAAEGVGIGLAIALVGATWAGLHDSRKRRSVEGIPPNS